MIIQSWKYNDVIFIFVICVLSITNTYPLCNIVFKRAKYNKKKTRGYDKKLDIIRENMIHLERKYRLILKKDEECPIDHCFGSRFIRTMLQNHEDVFNQILCQIEIKKDIDKYDCLSQKIYNFE